MRGRALANETAVSADASLYDRDFALWVEAQVAAIRAGTPEGLDVANLIEELEGLTKREERAMGSPLKRIMAHLLKQRYQPERATRTWEDSIANGREEIVDILDQSPSLRRTLPAWMARMYPRAVGQAARDTRLPVANFPDQPPFTLAEVLGEDQ